MSADTTAVDGAYYFKISIGTTTTTVATLTVAVKPIASGTALWARTVSAGSDICYFNSVVNDSLGNVYAAGYQGTGTHTYGPGISITGTATWNVVLVKYNASGQALWAQTLSAGTQYSWFDGVAVDTSGNVYAAGFQYGTESYSYGTVSATGAYGAGNVVLVKYNASGVAQWAQTVTAGVNESCYDCVAVDSSGNVYAAGYQVGTGSYTYGTGVSASGTAEYVSGTGYNAVIVKYNALGVAQWAQTVSAGASDSSFRGVATDSSGNVYAAGFQTGTGSYTYGTVSATGTCGTSNVVLVKYNATGQAQWAQTTTTTSPSLGQNYFNCVAVDSSGNVYVAGYQGNKLSYTYGTGVSASGTSAGVVVKYNTLGVAQWAQAVSASSSASGMVFYGIAVDSTENVYAAGIQGSTYSYTYGTGVSAIGTALSNVVLVKYNASGLAQWAQTLSAGANACIYKSVTVDTSGNVYAAGNQTGTESYTYSPGISAFGPYSGDNVLLVKYQGQ
jgi:hypothetical protein